MKKIIIAIASLFPLPSFAVFVAKFVLCGDVYIEERCKTTYVPEKLPVVVYDDEMLMRIPKAEGDELFQAPNYDAKCVLKSATYTTQNPLYRHFKEPRLFLDVDTSQMPIKYQYPLQCVYISPNMHHPEKDLKNQYGYELLCRLYVQTTDGKVYQRGPDWGSYDMPGAPGTFLGTFKEVPSYAMPPDTEWIKSAMTAPECSFAFVPLEKLPSYLQNPDYIETMRLQREAWQEEQHKKAIEELQRAHDEEIANYREMVRILAKKAGIPLPPEFDEK